MTNYERIAELAAFLDRPESKAVFDALTEFQQLTGSIKPTLKPSAAKTPKDKILKMISDAGTDGILSYDITLRTRAISQSVRNGIILALCREGLIVRTCEESTGGRPAHRSYLAEFAPPGITGTVYGLDRPTPRRPAHCERGPQAAIPPLAR